MSGKSWKQFIAFFAQSFHTGPWPPETPDIIHVAAWHISCIRVSLSRSGESSTFSDKFISQDRTWKVKKLMLIWFSTVWQLTTPWPLTNFRLWTQVPAVLVNLGFQLICVSGSKAWRKTSSLNSRNKNRANSCLFFSKWVKYFLAKGWHLKWKKVLGWSVLG